jgi:initiation factor 1A
MVRLVNRQDNEEYALVEKALGSGQLKVKCLDGVSRLCIIRGKFKGKKKEYANVDSWVLVGIHTYESKPKCSLLEIYNAHEIHELKLTNENWKIFGVEQLEEEEPDMIVDKKSVVVETVIDIDDI